jgi:6-phosphogluconolactonase
MIDTNMLHGASDAQIADWLEARLRAALGQTDGSVAIAVPGGSTPFPILEQLVTRDIEWQRVKAYPTDDRLVAEGHPASNTGKLRALLEPAGADVVALTEIERPDGAAAVPFFALVWLGMGADGHIASLFPNTDPQGHDPRWIRRLTPDPLPPEAPFDRITLTIPALLNSAELLLVARGDDKRAVLDAALNAGNDLPIARLLAAGKHGHHRPVTVFT